MRLDYRSAKVHIGVFLLTAVSLTGGCMADATQTDALPSPSVSPVHPTAAVGQSNSPIRQIGFHDFTPPPESCSQRIELESGSARFVTEKPVRQGAVGAAYIDYGEVTGDSQEEAFVVVAVETEGSAIPHCVYVYTLQSGAPRLLWSVQTGDRADFGLRRLYGDEGKLMVELYSPDGNKGACCPTQFRRIALQWDGSTFKQIDAAKVFEQSSDRGAIPTMPEYKQ
jgi:hypothetical protein